MAEFQAAVVLRCPIEEVFAFHARPANLLRVTPPAWHLELVNVPEELCQDCLIELRMHRWGIKQRVLARVTEFDPPYRLADEQVRGPFARWRHLHLFQPVHGGSTRLIDIIEFEPPRGLLGLVFSRRKVLRELTDVFQHRHARTRGLLETGSTLPALDR